MSAVDLIARPSPNHDERAAPISMIVLHYTGMPDCEGALDRLASALAPDGWLMLGAGETVIGQAPALEADKDMRGLYRHKGEAARAA